MVPGSAEWWAHRRAHHDDRPRRPRADGLTLERILDAALAVVDADGLEALTMRRLATELGCGHTSLYRHVASHHEIVVLLVDRVLGTIAVEPPAGVASDPREHRRRAEEGLRRYRATLLAHPGLTPALLAGQMLGPNALARREEALALLVAAGAPPDVAVQAYLSLTHFVIASVVFESSGAGRTPSERAAMRTYFSSLPAATYPTLVSLAHELNEVDADAEFEFGLRALLDLVTRRVTEAVAR